MNNAVQITRSKFLDGIREALESDAKCSEFQDWLERRYWTEDEYSFEDTTLEDTWCHLEGYLEDCEIDRDPDRRLNLRRLLCVLEAGRWTTEYRVYALEYDQITKWLTKREKGVITEEVYRRKILGLSLHPFDEQMVLALWRDDPYGLGALGERWLRERHGQPRPQS
jgi:hypothetical protein